MTLWMLHGYSKYFGDCQLRFLPHTVNSFWHGIHTASFARRSPHYVLIRKLKYYISHAWWRTRMVWARTKQYRLVFETLSFLVKLSILPGDKCNCKNHGKNIINLKKTRINWHNSWGRGSYQNGSWWELAPGIVAGDVLSFILRNKCHGINKIHDCAKKASSTAVSQNRMSTSSHRFR